MSKSEEINHRDGGPGDHHHLPRYINQPADQQPEMGFNVKCPTHGSDHPAMLCDGVPDEASGGKFVEPHPSWQWSERETGFAEGSHSRDAEVAELQRQVDENRGSQMSANQCIIKGGLLGDDWGHQYCQRERERDAAQAQVKKLQTECNGIEETRQRAWERAHKAEEQVRALVDAGIHLVAVSFDGMYADEMRAAITSAESGIKALNAGDYVTLDDLVQEVQDD